MNKGLKTTLIVLSCLILTAMLAVNVWWFYILFFGPDKVISNTFEIGLQKTTDGEQRYFVEINYFSNAEKNGLECFEIKYNYMLDENQTAFYSQGLQYTAKSGKKIAFDYYKDASVPKTWMWQDPSWPVSYNNWAEWGGYKPTTTTSVYNYASGDNYENVTLSTNPISTQTRFKIQLGDDLFMMKFKNENTPILSENFMYKYTGDTTTFIVYNETAVNWCYAYYDYSFFSKILYESISKTVASGTNHAMIFEFGDLFDYYKEGSNPGEFVEITDEKETEKVKKDIKSYYSIKVTTSANGIQKASDSLFNAVNGSTSYNTTPDLSDDYFIGRTHITVTEKDFDLVIIETGYCVLKLKEDFIDFYSQFDTIIFNVEVNLDVFNEKGIEIFGFANDSGLGGFNIESCYFLETVNGEITRTEVTYA